jgi:hypothetical protein
VIEGGEDGIHAGVVESRKNLRVEGASENAEVELVVTNQWSRSRIRDGVSGVALAAIEDRS